MVFKLLDKELQKAIVKRFEKPTLIQELVIPKVLAGKNVLAIAPTGVGKTESALFGIFDKILRERPKQISTLYITPLKSLNRDLLGRINWWGKELDIEVTVRHGDTSQYERKMQIEFPNDIMFVTLETLQPMLTGKNIREVLRNVKYIVLDEIHEAVDSKRGVQLAIALERLRELCGNFQLVMISATVSDPERVAKFFAGGREVEIVKATMPKSIDIRVISPSTHADDRIAASKLYCSPDTAARIRTIMDAIKENRSTLTFTNTREFAEILASRIKTIDKQFPIEVHHSSLSKDVRIKTEKEFKEEKIKSIIATSSLQLGIDIGSVDLTLQYMSPRTVSQLIQRVGRSGHDIERTSKGIIIASDEDDIFESAVIARKALVEELEPLRMHEKSYDVLAHQIVGLTLENWKMDLTAVYKIIQRAAPYSQLTFPEFMSVCTQLRDLGLVFLNGPNENNSENPNIKKKMRGFEYYFTQLSTIPDTKQYRIFNMINNSFVGVLDEEFVALHGQRGTNFIVKGEAWRIVDQQEDKIFVEPTEDIEASIPGWEGELIPVSHDVAQEVGKVRSIIAKELDKTDDTSAIVDVLQKNYPIDANCAKKMIMLVKKQKNFGSGIIPDNKTILVEEFENLVVMQTCFGTQANETLGRFIVALLAARLGSIGLRTDPYRIMLQFQKSEVAPALIKEALFSTSPEFLQSILELSLTKNELFEWKFVHVAKRFGAISRGAEYGKVRMGKIIDSYAGSPIYKETLAELETEKLDIALATEILKQIQEKKIKIVFANGLSPIGKLGVQHRYAEIIGPDKPEVEIFELFKQRLLNTKVKMICVNCGQWDQTFLVKEVPDDLKCGKCEARLLGVAHPKNLEIQKIIKKKLHNIDLAEDNAKKFERIRKTADLFLVYGKKTVVCLAARGVGPETTKRILAKYHRTEEDMLRDILEAEKNYLKNKRFWSV
jgi:ATP-dependent Lhr-like helicase